MSDAFTDWEVWRRPSGVGADFVKYVTVDKAQRFYNDPEAPTGIGFDYTLKQRTLNGIVVPFNNVSIGNAPGTMNWAAGLVSGTASAPGGSNAWVTGVATDSAGRVNVIGSNKPGGQRGAFIQQYNRQGQLAWTRTFKNATGDTLGWAIAVDGADNFIITGEFTGTIDFVGTSGQSIVLQSLVVSQTSTTSIFVAKYNSSGVLQWAFGYGGYGNPFDVRQMAIAVHSDNTIFLATYFTISIDFGNGTGTLNTSGGRDFALVKFNSSGIAQWSTGYGGSGSGSRQIPSGIALDSTGNIFLTGYLPGDNGNVGGGAVTISPVSQALFLGKYSGVNGAHQWSRIIHGTSTGDYQPNNIGYAVAVDPRNGNVVFGGGFNGRMDFGNGPIYGNVSYGGGMYLASYDTSGNPLWSKAWSGVGAAVLSARITVAGEIFFCGRAVSSFVWGDSFSTYGNGLFLAKFLLNSNSLGEFKWELRGSSTNSNPTRSNWLSLDPTGNVVMGGDLFGTIDFGGTTITSPDYPIQSGFVASYIK